MVQMSVSIEHLIKSYKDNLVLNDISIEIENQIFGLLGPNGAGKTTLVNILCGLLNYDSGKVSVNGMDPIQKGPLVRSKIGLVPQETALYEYLTAKENLDFHAKLYGIPRASRSEKVQEVLELAQLSERKNDRVNTFSGGMKRRLALVRSLLHNPEILILDEPSLGVDVQSRNNIWNHILQINREEGKTIIVTTNYMDEASKLADICTILDQGKMLVMGSPSELKNKFGGKSMIELVCECSDDDFSKLIKDLKQIVTVVKQTKNDRQYSLSLQSTMDSSSILAKISAIIQSLPQLLVKDLNLRLPTLDDVFLNLTGSSLRE